MKYSVLFSCTSHIGKCRSMNQDNFICNGVYMENEGKDMTFPLTGKVSAETPSLFGVFDGMGGEECGEVAALIAAKQAQAVSFGKNAIKDISEYCLKANEEICDYAQSNAIGSMGTTAAMLVFAGSEVVLCNIGDSKIFRFSDGALEQISQDHVAMSVYGRKPPLTQNLGIPPTEMLIEPYVVREYYNHGDIFLICSDGLTDMVKSEEIRAAIAGTPFDDITQVLLDKALENGGRDNITIIACKTICEDGWLKRILRTITEGV